MKANTRAQKLNVLQAALAGNSQAVQNYRQAIQQPIRLTVQKEPDNCYTVKHPAAPAGLMTEPEFEKFLEQLRRNYQPVICMIRPCR